MKTFFNLVQEVQKPGLCHRCGGCVTFCTAINYGALDLDEDGKPYYSEMEKCIECGLCYAICPEIDELEEETRRNAAWSEPLGRVIETTVVQATDAAVRDKATDGGAVTALLLHLFDRGRIDGAIVAKPVGQFQRQPFLATTRDQIQDAAGLCFDTSHGMQHFSDRYMTFSSIEEFDPLVKKGLKRVALVGTPCQIKSVRRMQVMGLVPSDSHQSLPRALLLGQFYFRGGRARQAGRTRGLSTGRTPPDQPQGPS
jgi:coenzyme F420 hydrogenase subunit beta